MASFETNTAMAPHELSAECAFHLYDTYYRPSAFSRFGQGFRQWLETTPEGQAYQIIVEHSVNPVKTRDYIVKYAS